MHRRLPSFSFNTFTTSSANSSTTSLNDLSEIDNEPRTPARQRSRSPFRRNRSKTRIHESGDDAEGGVKGESGAETDASDFERHRISGSTLNGIRNAFDDTSDSGDDSSSEEESDVDETLERNTEANATFIASRELLSMEPKTYIGEGPNIYSEEPSFFASPTATLPRGSRPLRRRSTKTKPNAPLTLVASAPVFEKNRCTVILTHGEPDTLARDGRRRRRYLVASDLSKESSYAMEWAIGTLCRDGDELIIVYVIETDSKFDGDDKSPADKKAKILNQKDRQAHALILSRQATALLERTRLNVRVPCQVVHDQHPRHLLLDMIDYYEPTLVVVGTRGRSHVRGMLLGSVSNYLLQKSLSPVMVTRRPLRVTRVVDRHRSKTSLNRNPRMSLKDAAIDKESHGGTKITDSDEPTNIAEVVEHMAISER